MKLLLIEDEVSLSDALAYMLRKNGYLVDTAYDGISGEEMAETDAYDLLIVDRMLPKKEGVEIIRALRNKGIKPNILGYREMNQYLEGTLTKEEALTLMKRNTRRYAKRQETFFNNQMQTIKINNDEQAFDKIIKELALFWW